MKLVHSYDYPTSTRASLKGLRHYDVAGEEHKLPSVTTVLGQTTGADKEASLAKWRDRVGHKEAAKIVGGSGPRYGDAFVSGEALSW
jgi:hypothetical protein